MAVVGSLEWLFSKPLPNTFGEDATTPIGRSYGCGWELGMVGLVGPSLRAMGKPAHPPSPGVILGGRHAPPALLALSKLDSNLWSQVTSGLPVIQTSKVTVTGATPPPHHSSTSPSLLPLPITPPPPHHSTSQSLHLPITPPPHHSSTSPSLHLPITPPPHHSTSPSLHHLPITPPPHHSTSPSLPLPITPPPPNHSSTPPSLHHLPITPPPPHHSTTSASLHLLPITPPPPHHSSTSASLHHLSITQLFQEVKIQNQKLNPCVVK